MGGGEKKTGNFRNIRINFNKGLQQFKNLKKKQYEKTLN